MADSFDEREKSFEAKWARDEQLRFRVYARRNRMLGLWAAGQMGISGAEADAYASQIVAAQLQKNSEEVIFTRIRSDFDAHAVKLSDHMIRREMDDLLASAMAQIKQDLKG